MKRNTSSSGLAMFTGLSTAMFGALVALTVSAQQPAHPQADVLSWPWASSTACWPVTPHRLTPRR